jgi:hypothetical protein
MENLNHQKKSSFDSFFSYDPPKKEFNDQQNEIFNFDIEIDIKDLKPIQEIELKIGAFGMVSKMIYQSKNVAVKSMIRPEETADMLQNEIIIHR